MTSVNRNHLYDKMDIIVELFSVELRRDKVINFDFLIVPLRTNYFFFVYLNELPLTRRNIFYCL